MAIRCALLIGLLFGIEVDASLTKPGRSPGHSHGKHKSRAHSKDLQEHAPQASTEPLEDRHVLHRGHHSPQDAKHAHGELSPLHAHSAPQHGDHKGHGVHLRAGSLHNHLEPSDVAFTEASADAPAPAQKPDPPKLADLKPLPPSQPMVFSTSCEHIHVFTDMEGDYDFMVNFFVHLKDANAGQRLEDKAKYGFTFLDFRLNDGHCIANLGDMLDCGGAQKRSGVFRGVATFLNLQDKHGQERVKFLLGNRDANKLRLPFELSNPNLIMNYWEKFNTDGTILRFSEDSAKEDNEVGRLKWILSKTMGAGASFEGYKEEMKLLGKEASDEDVAKYIKEQVKEPKGLFHEYLSRSGLVAFAEKNGKGAIFVHGNVAEKGHWTTGSQVLKVPALTDGLRLALKYAEKERKAAWQLSGTASGGKEFVNKYHEWKKVVFKEWADNLPNIESFKCADENTAHLCRPGNALMDLSLSAFSDARNNGMNPVSTINSAAVSAFSKEFAGFLTSKNIRYVFTGHIPRGATAEIWETETASGSFKLVNSDVTYAHMHAECSEARQDSAMHCLKTVSPHVRLNFTGTQNKNNLAISGWIQKVQKNAEKIMYTLPSKRHTMSKESLSAWAGPATGTLASAKEATVATVYTISPAESNPPYVASATKGFDLYVVKGAP